jgi:hypothetical protein
MNLLTFSGGIAATVIFLLFAPCRTGAQTRTAAQQSDALEAAVERLLEAADEADASMLSDRIDRLLADPVCLTSADAEDLIDIPLIDEGLALLIQTAVQRDSVRGWTALRRLPGMDKDRYAFLRACATFDCDRSGRLNERIEYRGRIQQEDRPRRGFLDGRYAPARARIMQRVLAQGAGKVRIGLIQERDPGEHDFFDHAAGYVSIESLGPVERAVLGDFTVAAGNGLVFWQSFGISKSADALSAGRRSSRLLTPYASATEGLFYRGAAVELRWGGLSALAFLSRNALDASIDAERGTAGSFGIDGLHRTESELRRRRSVREDVQGYRLQAEQGLGGLVFRAAVSGWMGRYSAYSDPRTPFGFRGDRAWVVGSDAAVSTGRFSLFGEIALCHLDRSAVLLGLRSPLHRSVDAVLLWRSYNERFVNIHGLGFGERGGELQNERGLYVGLRSRPAAGLRLDAWMDIFAFPNRTYLLHLPTSGGELMLNASWDASRVLTVNARLAHGEKDNTVAAEDEYGRQIRPLARRAATSLRVELIAEASSGIRLRFRADRVAVRYDAWRNNDDGILLLADCRVAIARGLALSGRLAVVESGGYDARIYQFEPDVPGVMQNVALYGRSWRAMLLADWKAGAWLRLTAKWAMSIRDAERSIGSGADAVEGDALGRGTLQVELRW